jgi:hypothetical protein
MTHPEFPMPNQPAERRAHCAEIRGRQIALIDRRLRDHRGGSVTTDRRHAASDSFDWIDHLAANLPGCETSVLIDGDGIELPHAQN